MTLASEEWFKVEFQAIKSIMRDSQKNNAFFLKVQYGFMAIIKFKIKIQITVMNSIRKGNRALLPLN